MAKKKKSMDYILGMITGTSLMVAAWAAGDTIQEVKVVNQSWEPVYMDIVD